MVVFSEHAQPYLIPLSIAVSAVNAPHRWALVCEDGRRFDGTLMPASLGGAQSDEAEDGQRLRCHLRWVNRLPCGYHRFTLEGPEGKVAMPLIIAPHRCYVPPALDGGARAWGPALQLYALRSERNWGMGDFTDLRNMIELAARADAAIVGLNPLHELNANRPADASPYSPCSRLYLNIL